MCLHLCVVPLVMCPGLWIGDISGTCSMVSLPPMCTQAYFWMKWKIPPQYVNADEARPYALACPSTDYGDSDSAADPSLYDASQGQKATSPILAEAVKGETVALT